MSDHKGLSTHEIVMETRDMLADHMEKSHTTELEITRALASRPTRTEVIKWMGGLAILAGFSAFLS